MNLTNDIFFDTDCLSSFLWVQREDIMFNLFSNIIIPVQVEEELKKINHLYKKLKNKIDDGTVKILDIEIGTEECELFLEFTQRPRITKKLIGNGEASALALAKVHKGIIASNNLKDISIYIQSLNIEHITTGDILQLALNKNIIAFEEAEKIWLQMLNKKRKLGFKSFSEFLSSKNY